MLFYLISVIMLSRLYPLYSDEHVTINKLIIVILLQLLLLMFLVVNYTFFLLSAIFIIVDLAEYLIEQRSSRLNLIRFAIFILFCIISVIFSLPVGLNINIGMLSFVQNLFKNINPAVNLNTAGLNILIIISGLLFLLNESNFLIRLIFEVTGKVPVKKESKEPDKSELNAGRIIGMLERLIIFFFVTIGQFAAVGFVIAAKSIVRYKELEDRNFAEYVLIGTLLSSLIAILAGFAVARLLV